MSTQNRRAGLRITKRQYRLFKQSVIDSPEKSPNNDTTLYQQMFERNRAVKLLIDPLTMRIVNANQAAFGFYGYTTEQMLSLHLTDLNPLSGPEISVIMRRVIAEQDTTFQTLHRLASGEIRAVEVFTGLLDVDDKQFLYAIVQDITARLQAEKALRESEELHLLLTTHMPNTGVIMFDRDMRYTLAEGPFLKRFGATFENIVGKMPQETLPAESLNFLLPIYERALQGESFHYERTTDVFAYESFVTPIRADGGQIIGGMILSHDITERKRLEDDLRASEERLRLIIDNIQDLVTYDDVKGNFVYVSPSSRAMLGYAAESLLNASSIEIIHPDDRASMTQILGEALKTGTSQFTVEGRLLHADGHYVDIETVGKMLTDDGSNFTGGVFITRDVTQRKRMQELELEKEKLKIALEKEQEFSFLKTRMMQRINHEFRTPLTIIQASTETLTHYLDRLTAGQMEDKESAIKAQVKRLTNMLDEIQLLVQDSFKPNFIHRLPADIGALCRRVVLDLENQLGLLNKFVLDLPERVIAHVDAAVFEKAIYHIFHNAARFSAPSTVVNVSLALFQQGIEVRVTDEGSGILPHEQRRIFEPFFSGSNAREITGLGIGLSVARAAIEAHGGTITIMSAVGKGTSVTLWLPM